MLLKQKTFYPNGTSLNRVNIIGEIWNHMTMTDSSIESWANLRFQGWNWEKLPQDIYTWIDEQMNNRLCQNYTDKYYELMMKYGDETDEFQDGWFSYLREFLEQKDFVEKFKQFMYIKNGTET